VSVMRGPLFGTLTRIAVAEQFIDGTGNGRINFVNFLTLEHDRGQPDWGCRTDQGFWWRLDRSPPLTARGVSRRSRPARMSGAK
jgi:hypothetical protein